MRPGPGGGAVRLQSWPPEGAPRPGRARQVHGQAGVRAAWTGCEGRWAGSGGQGRLSLCSSFSGSNHFLRGHFPRRPCRAPHVAVPETTQHWGRLWGGGAGAPGVSLGPATSCGGEQANLGPASASVSSFVQGAAVPLWGWQNGPEETVFAWSLSCPDLPFPIRCPPVSPWGWVTRDWRLRMRAPSLPGSGASFFLPCPSRGGRALWPVLPTGSFTASFYTKGVTLTLLEIS